MAPRSNPTVQVEIFNSVIEKKINAEFNGQILNIDSESEGKISLNIQDKELSLIIKQETILANETAYSLHTEAIYMDHPFIIDNADQRTRMFHAVDHRTHLQNKLLRMDTNIGVVDEIVVEKKFRNIYDKLTSVCDGRIVQQKNGRLSYQIKKAEGLLSVKNLSTGLKTFAILKTLLVNGVIEKNGIIILDEPEIHLHPEWQLLFAELIVLLHKEFNLNILLNTHSPYFLRAIQVYAGKYKVGDICKYYLAEDDEDSKSHVIDATDNIDQIFAVLSEPLQKLEDERWEID